MSTAEPAETEAAPKRRGRPAGTKTRKRHDPAPAPVDGDYQPLDIVGKQPGFEYFAFSDHDRQRRGHQFEPERWSEKCAHPPWEQFREELRGQEVKVGRQLTLMRAPKAQVEARRKRERDSFRAASAGIAAADTDRGHSPQKPTIHTTHTIPVHGAY